MDLRGITRGRETGEKKIVTLADLSGVVRAQRSLEPFDREKRRLPRTTRTRTYRLRQVSGNQLDTSDEQFVCRFCIPPLRPRPCRSSDAGESPRKPVGKNRQSKETTGNGPVTVRFSSRRTPGVAKLFRYLFFRFFFSQDLSLA